MYAYKNHNVHLSFYSAYKIKFISMRMYKGNIKGYLKDDFLSQQYLQL